MLYKNQSYPLGLVFCFLNLPFYSLKDGEYVLAVFCIYLGEKLMVSDIEILSYFSFKKEEKCDIIVDGNTLNMKGA
ncbi:MAG: hypothetical protein FWE02_04680 [Defluviitaleaceae bacterium]|nr:hypothetical protein [Defluviitaleaceae bacterium]